MPEAPKILLFSVVAAAAVLEVAACSGGYSYSTQSSFGAGTTGGNLSSPGGGAVGCTTTDQCPRGQVCSAGYCQAAVAVTGCKGDYECTPPNFCIMSTCRPLGNAGEACIYNNDCLSGMICSGGACTVTTFGSPCKTDSDCNAPNYCIMSYCRPLSGQGGVCAADQDCVAGLVCSYGICSSTSSGYACQSDNDCLRPNYCIVGFCRPLSDPGGPCQYNYDCKVGMICSAGACLVTATGSPCNHDNDCTPPNFCIVAQCRPLSGVGGVCAQSIDCISGLVCSSGYCASPTAGVVASVPCGSDTNCAAPNYCIVGYCRPLSYAGGVCAVNQDCQAGLVCSNGSCVQSTYGTPCTADADCAAPNYCIVGYCRPLSSAGGKCGKNNDCLAGMVCSNGICVQSQTGTPCTADADCVYPDYCIVGYCRPLQGAGGICSINSDCQSGLVCVNGTCTY